MAVRNGSNGSKASAPPMARGRARPHLRFPGIVQHASRFGRLKRTLQPVYAACPQLPHERPGVSNVPVKLPLTSQRTYHTLIKCAKLTPKKPVRR
jgi:hypothetical protein